MVLARGCRRGKGQVLFHELNFRFAKEKSSGDLFHNSVNVLNAVELYAQKMS